MDRDGLLHIGSRITYTKHAYFPSEGERKAARLPLPILYFGNPVLASQAVFAPASCSFSRATICASVNLARLICLSFSLWRIATRSGDGQSKRAAQPPFLPSGCAWLQCGPRSWSNSDQGFRARPILSATEFASVLTSSARSTSARSKPAVRTLPRKRGRRKPTDGPSSVNRPLEVFRL